MKAKKMAAFAMASVLALTAAVPALAADNTVTSAGGSSAQDVWAYTEKDPSAYTTSVNVTVNWSAVNGAYSVSGDSYTWVPASGTVAGHYTKTAGSTVTKKSEPAMTITLTNNSDVYEDYTISYTSASGYEAIEESAAEDSNKTGTLAAYTAVNAVIPQATGTTTSRTNMAGKNTATYTGSFTTDTTDTEHLNITGGATIIAGTYTVTLSAPEKSELTYVFQDDEENVRSISAQDLLDTQSSVVSYTDPYTAKTVYAYNGYISATSYCTWYDAMAFVQLLNENCVKPSSGENGTWRLLSSENDGQAWEAATTEAGFDSGIILYLWNSGEYVSEYGTSDAIVWDRTSQCFGTIDKGCNDSAEVGFVVIWAPAA